MVMFPDLLIISILISVLDVNNEQHVNDVFEIVTLISIGFTLSSIIIACFQFYLKKKHEISVG